jgi:hypothetical protein
VSPWLTRRLGTSLVAPAVAVTGGGIIAPASAPVAPSGFPDATNTGVPAGTTLTPSGSVTVSTPGATIDALDISGSLTINAANVTVKRCRIRQANSNIVRILAAGCTIQDCEIDGLLTGSTAIFMENTVQCFRLNIHGCENGGDVNHNGGLIKDSWIHDLSLEGSGFHTDGLQFDQDASFLTIDHCHFQPIPSGIRNATSCINIDNESNATNNNITVQNCLIDGRGCGSACYLPRFPGWSNIAFVNNRMLSGDNGYCDGGNHSTWPGGGVSTFTGNVDHLTGAALTQAD